MILIVLGSLSGQMEWTASLDEQSYVVGLDIWFEFLLPKQNSASLLLSKKGWHCYFIFQEYV